MDQDFGEAADFAKKIRSYFHERGYKFNTITSNTIMVRASVCAGGGGRLQKGSWAERRGLLLDITASHHSVWLWGVL